MLGTLFKAVGMLCVFGVIIVLFFWPSDSVHIIWNDGMAYTYMSEVDDFHESILGGVVSVVITLCVVAFIGLLFMGVMGGAFIVACIILGVLFVSGLSLFWPVLLLLGVWWLLRERKPALITCDGCCSSSCRCQRYR